MGTAYNQRVSNSVHTGQKSSRTPVLSNRTGRSGQRNPGHATQRAVEEIHNPLVREGFYSNMFLVPKKDGRQRPVFNLKKLNTFVHTPHFKMEGCICCGLFSSCQS